MKIEKVNDHQIRCTLTREDLASRKLKISELAYGTKKAKNLFRDMMEMANTEYGFEADNIPLMIEAIPINSECIVLIITKVEDPEELDTRFSKFSPQIHEADDDDEVDDSDDYDDDDEEVDNVIDLFNKFNKEADKAVSEVTAQKPVADCNSYAFSYASIDELIKVSKTIAPVFAGLSSLYKNPDSGEYLIVVKRDKVDVADFVKVCNILSEYCAGRRTSRISEPYILEHFEAVITDTAFSTLSLL